MNAVRRLLDIGLISETGKTVGRTKQISVYKLAFDPKDTENGPVKESRNSHETVPFFPSNSPKNGTRIPKYPNLTQREGGPPIWTSNVQKKLDAAIAKKNRLFTGFALEHSLYGTRWKTKDSEMEYNATCQDIKSLRRQLEKSV